MARKNIFDRVMQDISTEDATAEVSPAPRRFGASKSISSSIDELARQAAKVADGEAIVELDPELLDRSFISDRMTDEEDDDYRELFEAIKAQGQDTPVRVRPNPKSPDRYMIVYGHRRVRVARELGRKVRAIVKEIDDESHVISQGQENSARANLSFIERVSFADRLENLGYRRETIQAALSLDYQTLSKMLTIPKAIPPEVISAVGPAKGVGRDRWLQMRKLVEIPKNKAAAESFVKEEEFATAPLEQKFDLLFDHLTKGARKPVKKASNVQPRRLWTTEDKSVTVAQKATGKSTTLVLSAPKGPAFGAWITANLESLYEAFRSSEMKQGD
ncbi:ParB family chromosome partitioning protein [Rhizobium petrolearium]|uniref:Plasmid partitioning protein RepB n=2 Tax=Neorhizobium TaxID=1525371 RepID=A0ABV0MCJ3_9HYPH|nr:plasmid partitioning protein RepB [Neorhizobium petrolearium]MBP1848328.1 ParB family chromosome partitioning protein [Neorhizobium petrolearium]MCC2614548.1 plasmid partitioning protein RepB [Neorhizobium petrolearium]WGI72307.1 plasmid partitioning protein RepB [Neorhizobium petrolearium]